MSDWLQVWENEDGDAWVEVTDAATEEEAGRRAAEQSGCVYVATGRGKINVQECECVPTHGVEVGEAHLDTECIDHPGTACIVRERVDCWGFESYGDLPTEDSGAEGPLATWYRSTIEDVEAAIADGSRAYLPRGWEVSEDGAVVREGSLTVNPEAPSLPMFEAIP